MKAAEVGDRIQALLARLSRREKFLVAGAALAFLGLITLLIVFNIRSSMADHRSRIEWKEQQLDLVVQRSAGFRDAQAEQRRLEARLKGSQNVSLFSFMEDLARTQDVAVTNMTPRQPSTQNGITEQSVDVTLDGVTLDKLAGIVNGIQRAPQMVKVKSVRVKRKFNDNERVEARLTVATYSLAAG